MTQNLWLRFRDWCEHNQPVFNTVVATWLSIAALVIAVAANRAAASQAASSQSQADTATLQLQLARAQTQPNFEIRCSDDGNPERYTLRNRGFSAPNITVEAHGFLRIAASDGEGNETAQIALIPFDRYLAHPTRDEPSTLVYERGGEPDSDLQLAIAMDDLSKEPHGFSVEPCVLFVVEYLDMFGQPAKQTYYADRMQSFRLSDAQAKSIEKYEAYAYDHEMWTRAATRRDPGTVYAWWQTLYPRQKLAYLQRAAYIKDVFP